MQYFLFQCKFNLVHTLMEIQSYNEIGNHQIRLIAVQKSYFI